MFLKEMQNNPREAQKQMMSDRAAGAAVGAFGSLGGWFFQCRLLGPGYLEYLHRMGSCLKWICLL